MRRPLLWPSLLLLLLLPAETLAQGCPAECQCSQPQTVFCISRRSQAIPQGLPPETANLYLFENGIRSLSGESFAGLPDLQLLDLSQNQISGLPQGVFQPLVGLCNLDLSSNQLHEITNESFHGLGRLERLYLDRNQIQHIHPAAFDSLENLLELKLQDNRLRALPPLRLPALLLLDLSRNPLAALEPNAFRGVPSLESLKVAGLGLGRLDEELLQGLGNLHELDLSDNQLPRVPTGALRELRGLTKLSLAGNGQISQLQGEDFQDLHGLQELDISNLRLTVLPRDLFGSFPRLKAITAAENPFNCICLMSWVVDWLGAGTTVLRRPEETRCHFPPKNAGRLLQDLQYADFGCPTTTTTTTTTTLRATTASPKLASLVPSSISSRFASPEPSTASGPVPADGSLAPTPFPFPEGQPSPEAHLCPLGTCLNGGSCRLDAGHHLECLCLPGFTGPYCESWVPVMTTPSITRAPTSYSKQIAVKAVGGTSLKVDLQHYVQSKPQLKGIRLTYWNLSGPDKRPVTLSLPASLPEYTVRALKPNSSYHLCIGPLGDKGHEEELCVEARTLPLTRQQHAPVTQSKDLNLTLVVVPVTAAVLLLVAVAAAISYYVWRRRRQRRRQGKEAAAALGAKGSSPLELEGAKACLEKGDPSGHSPKALSANGLEHEAPLVQPPLLQAGGGTTTPRPQRPSYF